MSPQELCLAVSSTLPSTLTTHSSGRGQPTILQGSVELSSQLRTEKSLHHSPSSQIPLSLCCLVPGGSRCCLELFIISLTLDLAAFKPLWPRDPKPTPQRSHPASIQLCAEASATSPQVQVSVSVPVKGNTVLSPLTSMRVHSGSPDHLYVCHSIKQAACSLQPASL